MSQRTYDLYCELSTETDPARRSEMLGKMSREERIEMARLGCVDVEAAQALAGAQEERQAFHRASPSIMDVAAAASAAIAASSLAADAEAILRLEDELDAAEMKAKALKEQVQGARKRLAFRLIEEETQSVRTSSGATVYLRRDLQVSKGTGVDTEQLIETLDALQLSDFARRQVIYMSLKSWVREQDEKHQQQNPGARAGEALPPPLRSLLNIYEEQTIGIRRGRTK